MTELSRYERAHNGECVIERFWGQTIIALPLDVGDLVEDDEWEPLIQKYFPDARGVLLSVSRFSYFPEGGVRGLPKGESIRDGEIACYDIVIPSVFDGPMCDFHGPRHPRYNVPDSLVKEILSRR